MEDQAVITFLTFRDRQKIYVELAEDLRRSVEASKAGMFACLEIEPSPTRDIYGEALGMLYPVFSEAIEHGPVVLLDADHVVKQNINELEGIDFDIACSYRGICENEWGEQTYLAGLVVFGHRRPQVARRLWLEWAARIYGRNPLPKAQEKTATKNDYFESIGWRRCAYIDQSELNAMMKEPMRDRQPRPGQVYEFRGYKVLPLARAVYCAKPGTEGAKIVHFKGGAKLK